VRLFRVGRGVLDQGQDAAGHEARGPDRRPAARHLAHLDHAPPVGDVHPAAGLGRDHLVGPGLLARVDHDLNPVTLHATASREPAEADFPLDFLPGRR